MNNRDALTHYVDGCNMCTSLNCSECETGLAITSLEKQIPIKVVFDVSTRNAFTSWGSYRCPCCNTILLSGTSDTYFNKQYCWHCGQLVEGDK